jgi:hypothetical protein
MSILMDLIGSTVIASFVILIGLTLNANVMGNSEASQANLNVQESMVDIVRTLEYDFRKIGYGVPETQSPIVDTGATYIKFRADMVNSTGDPVPDGTVDIIEWNLGPPMTWMPNPNVRTLYRRINGGPWVGASLGVVNFRLKYLNQDGGPPASITAIHIIETTLEIQSPYKIQDQVITDQYSGYADAFWRQTRLASRNIKRHG